MNRIKTGCWRDDADGSMRVISGSMGREREHFRAPPAARIDSEITSFLEWFESSELTDPVLKSALAHFRFVTIHPFPDGNGRISRAIADMQLARAERNPERWYSVAAAIRSDRNTYYEILEETQRGTGDLTRWLVWYLGRISAAMDDSRRLLERSVNSISFWAKASRFQLNERQRSMLARLLDGFEGNLTSGKWASLCHCSQDTANRDISALLECGLLVKGSAGGRSMYYRLS